jgi:cellulose synthase/poly-beta-1,6-N-acetylglucosamine synthase-like glycosyltransferase
MAFSFQTARKSHLALVHDVNPAKTGAPFRRSKRPAALPERLGQRLVSAGYLAPGDLVKALALQRHQDVRLGDILLRHRMVSEHEMMVALSDQWDAERINLADQPPDAHLVDRFTPGMCLRQGLVPWRSSGSITVIATAFPERFASQKPELEKLFGPVAMGLCTEEEIISAVEALRSPALAVQAENLVETDLSCRDWAKHFPLRPVVAFGLACLVVTLLAPVAVFAALSIWAIVTLFLGTWLKASALFFAVDADARHRRSPFLSKRDTRGGIQKLPVVSVMVPLFKEDKITERLLKRLSRLTYPRELTDICLVVEASDDKTRASLATTRLPHWVRVVIVPHGNVLTKPRALNYALNFCRGSIIGVWDAEDAPEADQLHKVVRTFRDSGPEVACVQGELYFYNWRTNWLSRCFAIEYASWFRVILPGLEKLGFAIPLGGTTLFFRREILEEIGGWDAHNVTEDADLGIRLARKGFTTRMVRSTTQEEANCRPWKWVKQRSRWLKGYAMTWAVHMRDPVQLWQDLGAWRFFGFQILFLCTLTQFLLAPILWSFWLVALGLWHPLTGIVPSPVFWGLGATFLIAEILNIVLGIYAVHSRGKQRLMIWTPSLHFYFPLGAIASYKAVLEMVVNPFYWDKTDHGIFDEHADDDRLGSDATDPLRPI